MFVRNLAQFGNNALSLMVNNISFSPYYAQVLRLEVTIPVNVEEASAIVLCSRSRNVCNTTKFGNTNDTTTTK